MKVAGLKVWHFIYRQYKYVVLKGRFWTQKNVGVLLDVNLLFLDTLGTKITWSEAVLNQDEMCVCRKIAIILYQLF